MSRRARQIIIVAIIILAIGSVVAAVALVEPRAAGTLAGTPDTIAVIRIEGPIAGGEGSSDILGSTVGADRIIEHIREAQNDDSIKAVVLRINSPGGSAAASQEIGNEVVKLRDSGKVVVTSMGDVAASGGYWIASLSDKIVANPATITGSIGVIMQLNNLEEFYRKLGLEVITIKSGPHKDMGSAARDLTEKEREILQAMVNDIFDQFVNVVADGRKMDVERVRAIADGRVFTGRQAVEAGLVDELGDFYDAVDTAAELAGLEDYDVREIGRLSPFERFLEQFGAGAGALRGRGLIERFLLDDRLYNLPGSVGTGE